MRYDLLSLLAIVGLAAWFVSARPPTALKIAGGIAFAAWMLVLAVPQIRFGMEYATRPPVPAKHQVIRALEAQGIAYGRADYWLAYYIDFLTRERIVIASDEPKRILMYDRIVADHAAEAVRLSRRPCDGGTLLAAGVYRCP
jgi:hypothetical protein